MWPYLQEAFETVRRDTTPKPDPENPRQMLPAQYSADKKLFYQTLMTKNAEKKYNAALHNYQLTQKKEGKALALLRLYVSDSIRSLLNEHTDPAAAYTYLKKQYKLSNHQNLQLIHKEIENLTLKNCKDLDNFFSQLDNYIVHLRNLQGSYDKNAVQAKIFRSLTPKYNEVLRMINLLYNQQGSS